MQQQRLKSRLSILGNTARRASLIDISQPYQSNDNTLSGERSYEKSFDKTSSYSPTLKGTDFTSAYNQKPSVIVNTIKRVSGLPMIQSIEEDDDLDQKKIKEMKESMNKIKLNDSNFKEEIFLIQKQI